MKKITNDIIEQIKSRIVATIHPEKIILFGSYAWGEPDETSDIDLFVIVSDSNEPSYRRAQAVYRCLRGIGVPVDIVVKTKEEVEKRKNIISTLDRRVMKEGKVLYG